MSDSNPTCQIRFQRVEFKSDISDLIPTCRILFRHVGFKSDISDQIPICRIVFQHVGFKSDMSDPIPTWWILFRHVVFKPDLLHSNMAYRHLAKTNKKKIIEIALTVSHGVFILQLFIPTFSDNSCCLILS